jgi:hypothetical protein
MAFELIPTGIVRSGHGWQPYWELTEWLENTPANRDRIEAMQRRFYLRLGGLDSVQDISRILRVPGTQNWKHPTEPLPVSVAHWSDRTYALAQFEPLLPPLVGQEVTYRETQALLAEGDRPALDLLANCLGTSIRLPTRNYILVWGAVAYYYPTTTDCPWSTSGAARRAPTPASVRHRVLNPRSIAGSAVRPDVWLRSGRWFITLSWAAGGPRRNR